MDNIYKNVKYTARVGRYISEYEYVEVYLTPGGQVFSYHVNELTDEATWSIRHTGGVTLDEVLNAEVKKPIWDFNTAR